MNITARWENCYALPWKGIIVPAAFEHPAKMARGLLHKIFDELVQRGDLKVGDLVVDPFGGIGTTGIVGAWHGMQVICCELEPRFVELALENFALHEHKFEELGLPQPKIIQGDSRYLRDHVRPAIDALVSSPPYVVIAAGAGGLNSLPPKHPGQQGGRSADSSSQTADQRYGRTAGQLARFTEGSVDATISSPPFTQGYSGGGGINVKGYGPNGHDKVGSRTYQALGADRDPRNLETMPYDSPGAAIASPMRETFWSGALAVVHECYAVLRAGGTAVWVVKAFVKGGKVVDFPGDWRKLCEHVGFLTLVEARAMMVQEERGEDLLDGERVRTKEKKSFFRRLQEKRGSPRIDWETIYIMRKP